MRVYSEQCDDAAECSVSGRCTVNVCVCETEFVLVGGYLSNITPRGCALMSFDHDSDVVSAEVLK